MRFGLWKVVCVTLGLTALCAGQAQVARAMLSGISIRQCNGHKSQYQLFLSARVVIENASDKSLSISSPIELIPYLRAASSEENARKGIFLFSRQDVFGAPNANLALPDVSAFRMLKPGEKATLLFKDPVELTLHTTGNVRNRDLVPGESYWLQFGFYAFPEYFYWNSEEFVHFKQEQSSVAQIPEGLIWTEPFRIVVERRDPHAPNCE